ncbi:MAG: class I SAM-dependent methyltransferase [Pseudomonadota bacterium]
MPLLYTSRQPPAASRLAAALPASTYFPGHRTAGDGVVVASGVTGYATAPARISEPDSGAIVRPIAEALRMDDLSRYYADRAPEYERIYRKPERQSDLGVLRGTVASYFAGCSVLEMACGTGYWSHEAARGARRLVGLDINEAVLAIARAKPHDADRVRFVTGDLYTASDLGGPFDAALAAHWWSHVPLDATAAFLDALHAQLTEGARVMLLDNNFVPGSSTPVSRRDNQGNTYQERRLDDGSTHEVLKNFPSDADLEAAVGARGADITIERLTYYWTVTYRVRAGVDQAG